MLKKGPTTCWIMQFLTNMGCYLSMFCPMVLNRGTRWCPQRVKARNPPKGHPKTTSSSKSRKKSTRSWWNSTWNIMVDSVFIPWIIQKNTAFQTLRMLVASRATPDLKDRRGWTPLHTAVQHGHLEVMVFFNWKFVKGTLKKEQWDTFQAIGCFTWLWGFFVVTSKNEILPNFRQESLLLLLLPNHWLRCDNGCSGFQVAKGLLNAMADINLQLRRVWPTKMLLLVNKKVVLNNTSVGFFGRCN